MPKVAASNGVRPEIRALAVLQLGKTVTPQEINDHVGTGDYAAKYVSFLNTRYGFTITANKDGRKVVSYNVVAEPANAADLRAMQPKAPKAKTAKAPKTVKLSTIVNKVSKNFAAKKAVESADNVVDIDAVKAKNLETMRKVAAKMKAKKAPKAKKVRDFDDVTETFGTSGEVGTSFSVERDWDSVEGLDLKNLL
jgi:hypothetical protein